MGALYFLPIPISVFHTVSIAILLLNPSSCLRIPYRICCRVRRQTHHQIHHPSSLFTFIVDGAAAVVDREDGIHHPLTFIQAAAVVDGGNGHALVVAQGVGETNGPQSPMKEQWPFLVEGTYDHLVLEETNEYAHLWMAGQGL